MNPAPLPASVIYAKVVVNMAPNGKYMGIGLQNSRLNLIEVLIT